MATEENIRFNDIYGLLAKQGSINSRFDELFERQIKLNDDILGTQNFIIDVLKEFESRIRKLEEKEAN